MTDDYEGGEEQQADPLDQFEGLFKTPVGQAMAREARIRIADYTQKKQIAEANMAAGQAFSENLSEMKGNFIGMVQEDPAATHLALDLAHMGVAAMVGTVPGVDTEHLDNIRTGVQRDIAHAAVMSVADRHEDEARRMLDHPRISELVGAQKDQLAGYIQGQAIARRVDGEAAARMMAKANEEKANLSAWKYMAAMVDPDTGDIAHPPGWAQRLMSDHSMPPEHKATLFDTYGRLMENGDVPASDPTVAGDLLRGIAGGYLHPMTALSAAGEDLRAADATYLAKLANDPTMRKRAGEISTTLDAARRTLATPENGLAGERAFETFANWLLPTARDGADLNPSSKEYVLGGSRMQYFAPTSSHIADEVLGLPSRGFGNTSYPWTEPFMSQKDRMTLEDIFGGNQRPVTGDQVLRTAPKPPAALPQTEYGSRNKPRATTGDQVLPPNDDNVAVR
jgi:hypothetical protein